ncbi:MAG: hypothetical protein MK003_08905, partial [Pseudomonadales bacterium]|nr:hypothetical protein [Pseudomonadales bacterium]
LESLLNKENEVINELNNKNTDLNNISSEQRQIEEDYNNLQYVMLSTSREAQAKSVQALLEDQEWAPKQQDWFDKKSYGRLVESYEVTALD